MSVAVIDQLWRYALAVIPIALVVAAVCRLLPCRPSTRYLLWLTVLCLFAAAPLLPRSPLSQADLARWGGSAMKAARQLIETDTDPAFTTRSAVAVVEDAAVTPTFADAPPTRDARPPRSGPSTLAAGPAPILITEPLAGPPTRGTARASDVPVLEKPVHRAPQRAARPVQRVSPPSSPAPAVTTDRAAVPLAGTARPAPAGNPAPARAENYAAWVQQLRIIRDALLQLPPIPAVVWGLGSAFLVILLTGRLLRSGRLLSNATPAPASVTAVVRSAAEQLGLANVPETLITEQRISPLIWCGRQPRLLLPAGLWDELDDIGRDAVVCHELAHLKRRDHWVCWLGALVGCLYWWHPVVWWVRRHLREEADLCCDAWVTSLMPAARRSYATALLQTKRFTSAPDPVGPSIGLGVTTLRAKRFARRLTMVMSQQHTARTTLGGLFLTAAVATAGWLVTPTLACPPSSDDAPRATHPVELKIRVAPKAPKAPKARKAPKATEPSSTFEEFMRMRKSGAFDDLSLQESLHMLEQHLPEAIAKVQAACEIAGIELSQLDLEHINLAEVEAHLPEIMEKVHAWGEISGVEIPDVNIAEIAELRVMLEQQARPAYEAAVRAFGNVQFAGAGGEGDVIIRTYKLPRGKLEGIIKLMSREDVPVLIAPGEKSLDVHGTSEQHLIFDAFCKMINGEDERQKYALSKGKLEALSELMIRPDVPILVSPGGEAIEVHGNTLEQAVFRAFVNMIDPKSGAREHADARNVRDLRARVREAEEHARDSQEHARARGEAEQHEMKMRQYEERARAQKHEMDALRKVRKDLQREAERHEQRYHQIERRVEEIEHKIEQVEREAEQIEDQAEDLDPEKRLRAIERVNKLLLRATELENEARMLTAEAEVIEMMAERLSDEADEIEDRIGALEESLEEMMAERGGAR